MWTTKKDMPEETILAYYLYTFHLISSIRESPIDSYRQPLEQVAGEQVFDRGSSPKFRPRPRVQAPKRGCARHCQLSLGTRCLRKVVAMSYYAWKYRPLFATYIPFEKVFDF